MAPVSGAWDWRWLGWVSVEQRWGRLQPAQGQSLGCSPVHARTPAHALQCPGKRRSRWSSSEEDMLALSCLHRSPHTWKGQLWRVGVSLTGQPGHPPDESSASGVGAPKWQTQEGSSPQGCSQERFGRFPAVGLYLPSSALPAMEKNCSRLAHCQLLPGGLP